MRSARISLLLCLTVLVCSLLLPVSDAWPSWPRVGDKSGRVWLRPWRWLFARKDVEEEDVNKSETDGQESAPTATQQLPLESFGPGAFMNVGEDLVYVPFSSLKNMNNNPEWVW